MGAFRLEDDRLLPGPLAGSMMACPDPAMSIETDFRKAFSQPSVVSLAGDVLTLTPVGGGAALRFERVAPPRLAGSEWEVTGYNNGRQAVVSPMVGTRLTLAFSDHQVSGHGGCNGFHGAFTTQGASLVIEPLAITRKVCEEPVMAQEQAFIDALQDATTWAIERGMLDLHRADGERALTASEAGRE